MGYDFEAHIDTLLDEFDLTQSTREKAYDLVDELKEEDEFLRKFMLYGGYDAISAVIVYVAARQEREIVEADEYIEFVEESDSFEVSTHFNVKNFRDAVKKFSTFLELPNVVFKPEDYIDEYGDAFEARFNELGSLTQTRIAETIGVSEVALRYTYKDILDALFEGEDLDLKSVDLTPEHPSLETGDGLKEASKELMESYRAAEDGFVGSSPKSLAAAAVYLASEALRD